MPPCTRAAEGRATYRVDAIWKVCLTAAAASRPTRPRLVTRLTKSMFWKDSIARFFFYLLTCIPSYAAQYEYSNSIGPSATVGSHRFLQMAESEISITTVTCVTALDLRKMKLKTCRIEFQFASVYGNRKIPSFFLNLLFCYCSFMVRR